jgi:hypothetical protein
MDRLKNVFLFRDYFFERVVNFLNYEDWEIGFKDFKKRKKPKIDTRAEIWWDERKLYLDSRYSNFDIDHEAVKDLIHEFFHFIFEDFIIYQALDTFPVNESKEKNEQNGINRREYKEAKIEQGAMVFFNSLKDDQIKILKLIINDAKEEFLNKKRQKTT